MGISILNLGCFSFLSLPINLGLLRGFSKALKRETFAWFMASSFEEGGFGEEESEDWMMGVIGVALRKVRWKFWSVRD